VLPRWLRVTALLLAAALAVSGYGYGYLTLTNALAWTAFVSGVLLLLWVTGTGIALTVRRRALPANRPAVSRNSRPSLPAPETPAR
jgi:small-conductance mechanosensitive channel